MVEIQQADVGADRARIRELLQEVHESLNAATHEATGLSYDTARALGRDMATLDTYAPPRGRVFLALEGAQLAGIVFLHSIADGVAELNRMYVRPEFRRRGVGGGLLEAATDGARAMGHASLRLDTARFLEPALALYRGAGFHDADPHLATEHGHTELDFVVHLEKQL